MLVYLPIRFNRFFKSTASKTTLMFTPNIFVKNVNDCSIVLNMHGGEYVGGGCGPIVQWEPHARISCKLCKDKEEKTKGSRPKKTKKGLSGKAAMWATTHDLNEPKSTFKDTQQQQSGMDVSEEEVTCLGTPSHMGILAELQKSVRS